MPNINITELFVQVCERPEGQEFLSLLLVWRFMGLKSKWRGGVGAIHMTDGPDATAVVVPVVISKVVQVRTHL